VPLVTTLLDLPSPRTEGWRWSDLSALQGFAASAGNTKHRELRELHWLGAEPEGPRLLFVDGILDRDRSRLGPVGLAHLDLSLDHPLARHARGEGWRLRLGRDHVPPGLIQIVHVTTGAADHLPAQVELDVGAQASIVETYIGHGWTNRLSHFRLFKGARLMLSRRLLGDSGPSTPPAASLSTGFVSLTDKVEVGEGASFVATTLAAGGTDTRLDGDIRMAGAGAYAEAGGALLARGTQRHDANLVIHHAMPNGTSRQVWRSVADDRAICSVAARVEVARGAQKTDGEQSLKGIMLSRTATINAKPELEIFADDVKCAHGATVGELDRNALFYLASRGVPEGEAKGLLTRAFVADALERVGEEAVREAFYADVDAWFAGEGGAR
jgi:Fe-S cluster assembly protein SufD